MALNIIQNINHSFNSCYRPIIIEIEDTSTNTAFLRGELLKETSFGSGIFISTEILINAYETDSGTGLFKFNLMEYTRHYMNDDCMLNSLLPGDNISARFKLSVWSMIYDTNNPGILLDDLSNVLESNEFTVIPTITKESESTGLLDNYTSVESFVLSPTTITDNNSALTNMPVNQTVYFNDSIDDSIYVPVVRNSTYPNFVIKFKNLTTGVTIWLSPNLPSNTSVIRIPVTPRGIELFALLNSNAIANHNKFVDSSGVLLAKNILIKPIIHYYTGSAYVTIDGETRTFKVEETEPCRRTKFVFKNMRGGYDWFHAKGTENKSVSVQGTTFDKYIPYSGLPRGSHGTSNLWTKRVDSYSVFSQPLNKDWTVWLEELITSPSVWIEKDIENGTGQISRVLIPVIIDKGSYKTYTTEDSIHFTEFKYTLSNNIGTQRN